MSKKKKPSKTKTQRRRITTTTKKRSMALPSWLIMVSRRFTIISAILRRCICRNHSYQVYLHRVYIHDEIKSTLNSVSLRAGLPYIWKVCHLRLEINQHSQYLKQKLNTEIQFAKKQKAKNKTVKVEELSFIVI